MIDHKEVKERLSVIDSRIKDAQAITQLVKEKLNEPTESNTSTKDNRTTR